MRTLSIILWTAFYLGIFSSIYWASGYDTTWTMISIGAFIMTDLRINKQQTND